MPDSLPATELPHGMMALLRTKTVTCLATSTTKTEPGTLDVFASLRFFGDRLEPSRITEILDAAPTVAYRKGEIFKRVRGNEVRGRTGLWLISSEHRVEIPDLNDHLDYLLGIVFSGKRPDRLPRLQELMRADGIEADVPCFWYGEKGARPPIIREDIRERLARIPAGLELDFDTD
ncbi:MAG: DUF4279 domain-containing protein [Alphaproteobacteria bacterium]